MLARYRTTRYSRCVTPPVSLSPVRFQLDSLRELVEQPPAPPRRTSITWI